jgi:hypothetical protein
VSVTITTGSMPVKLPAMKSGMDPTPRYKPKTLKRDLRDNPLDDKPACRDLQFGVDTTKAGMMDAWNEMLPMVNLVPYYTEGWGPVFKRHGAMFNAIHAGKAKDVKGLMIQIVAAYKKIMKTGKWQPGPWGQEEPK